MRPLQKDLSLEEIVTESDVVSKTTFRDVCFKRACEYRALLLECHAWGVVKKYTAYESSLAVL